MSKFGIKRYREGLNRKTHDHDFNRNPVMSSDLKKALKKSKKAKEFFNGLAPSYRRAYLVWLESAKLPETRMKRIKAIVKACQEGKKPNEV